MLLKRILEGWGNSNLNIKPVPRADGDRYSGEAKSRPEMLVTLSGDTHCRWN